MTDSKRRMQNTGWIILIISFMLIIPPVIHADTIYFKNGDKLECEVKKYVEGQVGVQTGNKFFYIAMEDIKKIERKEYFEKDKDVNWLVVGITAGLTVLMFTLAICGREL